MSTDIIAAISTGGSSSGINIIRISGKGVDNIIKNIFTNFSKLGHQKIVYGKIVDPETKKVIDEVLVSCFLEPHSFTGEDVYEINTHGGKIVTLEVLKLVLAYGARLAKPGEFSKRAFLNGKMDLSKAEAIIDIINAKTKIQEEIAVNQLEGGLYSKIQDIREDLIELMAQIEVNIDYPEYDYEELEDSALKEKLTTSLHKIEKLLVSREEGKYAKEGINLAILGGTNAGKSSLLNRLANADRAIVTDIEGTTRDVVEESVVIGNLLVNISDTAGIRDTEDIVENIGIQKSLDMLKSADVLLYIIDATKNITDMDKKMIAEIRKCHQTAIYCVNKVDKISHETCEMSNFVEKCRNLIAIDNTGFNSNLLFISAKDNIGIEELKNKILEVANISNFDAKEEKIVVNERHSQNLREAKKHLNKAIESIEKGESIDMAAINITEGINELGNITGQTTSEDVIHKVFEKFCLGK